MHSPEAVHLVVPCFNEAKRFDRQAFVQALRDMPWLTLCFVDDGSSDATGALIEALRKEWPTRVNVLTLSANRGKAEAVREGLLAASTDGLICGFWDADLAAPLSELPALRELLLDARSFEWAWGIRVSSLGRRIVRRASRHYAGRVFATCASIALGIQTYDTQCGAKLFRVSPLLSAVISEPFVSRWIFDVEMVSRAKALLEASRLPGVDQLIIESPLSVWSHQPGSKVRTADFVRALLELLLIRRDRRRWSRALANWRDSAMSD